jgi:hypothetical protein
MWVLFFQFFLLLFSLLKGGGECKFYFFTFYYFYYYLELFGYSCLLLKGGGGCGFYFLFLKILERRRGCVGFIFSFFVTFLLCVSYLSLLFSF